MTKGNKTRSQLILFFDILPGKQRKGALRTAPPAHTRPVAGPGTLKMPRLCEHIEWAAFSWMY